MPELRFVCFSLFFFISFQSAALTKFPGHSGDTEVFSRADSAKKINLLKKLSDAIQFRKNAITKEQKRVQTIIEKIISKNPAAATIQDVEKLKQEISETNRKQLDTLLQLISEIKISEGNSSQSFEPSGESPKKPFQLSKELDPNDKYINDLVDRLVPMLTDTREEDNKVKDRQEKLRLMRAIYGNKKTFTDTINDSSIVKYRLKLNHKAEVIGYHQFEKRNNYSKYNLGTLTTLAYDSYELDGNTGLAKNFNRWDDASIISSAQQAGSKVLLMVTTKSSLEMAKFLTNEKAKRTMISNTLELLERRNADGINIAVTGLNKRLRSYFVEFIKSLSETYRAKPEQYQISITLPVFDEMQAYDIAGLDSLVDKFIIDFSKKSSNFPGPIAPLKDDSDYSIESSVSRYLNIGLPPYKFILCLPYYGAQFIKNPATGHETFKGYVPYNTIRLNYQYSPVTYNKNAAFASIETRDGEGNLTGHIYYDNETSLEEKYDFIIQNGLGGVAIWQLGADEGYGELWDALANKFVKIDTISKETVSLNRRQDATVWGYIKRNVIAYYHSLEHPCDPTYDKPETLLLTIFNIFLALLSIFLAIFLIYQIRAKGEKWEWKKTIIRILIVCVNLFIITVFMWLYVDNTIPWFGAGEHCLDMPFTVLLLIIFTGILFGSLIMRFLIFPVIQRDEKP